MRVSGARHLAEIGFDMLTIQLLARWDSAVIMRYVAEAPLGAITRRYRHLCSGLTLSQALGDTDSLPRTLQAHEQVLPDIVDHVVQEGAIRSASKSLVGAATVFVQNVATGCVHLAPSNVTVCAADLRKAGCGWRIRNDDELCVVQALPLHAKLICSRCLPAAHKAARCRKDTSSGSTSSSSTTTSSTSSS